MRSRGFKIGLLVGLMCWQAGGALRAAEMRVVGSDLLGAEFSRSLLLAAGRVELALAVAFDGSRPGLEALRAGRADVALVSFPANEENALNEFSTIPLGWHRVVALVPVEAPLSQITLPQLAGIFGRDARDDVQRWGELGVTGDWSNSPIKALVPVRGTGLALELFRRLALGGNALKPLVVSYHPGDDLALLLRGDSRAVAIAGAPLAVSTPTKVLAVAAQAGEPAFMPSPENLDSGDYPLRLPVQAAFAKANLPRVLPLLRLLLSEESAEKIDRAGLAALSVTSRRRELRELEKKEHEILQK